MTQRPIQIGSTATLLALAILLSAGAATQAEVYAPGRVPTPEGSAAQVRAMTQWLDRLALTASGRYQCKTSTNLAAMVARRSEIASPTPTSPTVGRLFDHDRPPGGCLLISHFIDLPPPMAP